MPTILNHMYIFLIFGLGADCQLYRDPVLNEFSYVDALFGGEVGMYYFCTGTYFCSELTDRCGRMARTAIRFGVSNPVTIHLRNVKMVNRAHQANMRLNEGVNNGSETRCRHEG